MCEKPTDPATHATGEKMIPLSAVAPLLEVLEWEFQRNEPMRPALVRAADSAKAAAVAVGWNAPFTGR